MSAHSAVSSGPDWASSLSLILTVAFAAAAIVWLHRLFVAEREVMVTANLPGGPTTTMERLGLRPKTVSASTEVAMAAGMAIMFGVM